VNNKKLIKMLQEILSDLFVEYHSLKQRHWHVEGLVFKDVHEFFDDCTDEVLGFIDGVGEYIVSFGAIAPTSLTTVMANYDIPTPKENERDAKALLQNGLDAMKYLKTDLTAISREADTAGEFGVTNFVQDCITKIDKLIYKYQAYLQKF
jgi:starvation-inducible DNA-binding protein